MAKYSKALVDQKRQHGKDLFIKGFVDDVIAEILSVSQLTVKKWARQDCWESAKQASFIALSEIRNTILQSFADLKQGKIPSIKPDQAAKYAAAFEKLSDKRKVLTYMYEAFELLTDEFLKDIQHCEAGQPREEALTALRNVRSKMDKVLSQITMQVLNNE